MMSQSSISTQTLCIPSNDVFMAIMPAFKFELLCVVNKPPPSSRPVKSDSDVSDRLRMIRHYRSIKKPLKDAEGKHQILIIAQDITEILRAQELVAESGQRLQEVLEVTREGIWDWHLPSGRMIHNRQWYETLGYAEGEIPNTVEAFANLIHPDDKSGVWQQLNTLLKRESEAYYSEHRLLLKEGQIIWVQNRGRVVERDAQGLPVRVVGSFSNISQRKQAEDELEQYRDHLEELVEERTTALYIAKEAAENANRAKSTFWFTACLDKIERLDPASLESVVSDEGAKNSHGGR